MLALGLGFSCPHRTSVMDSIFHIINSLTYDYFIQSYAFDLKGWVKMECFLSLNCVDLVDFQPFDTRETTFVTLCLLSCSPVPSGKGSTLIGKNLLPKEEKNIGQNCLP